MKRGKQFSQRWIRQAEHFFGLLQTLIMEKAFAEVCFFAQQSAEASLKAFLIYHGAASSREHSIASLLKGCSAYDKSFLNLLDRGKILDQYYMATRYPDMIPEPVAPYESFTEQQAKEAGKIAILILDTVKSKMI